jgi:hypothetical protein
MSVRSRLLDGSGEVVRHAAATLMTRCDEQMVALPRLGAALAACSIMLTAAQTTLPLEGGAANFDAGMSTRTLCALSVKWAAADGPQQGLYFKSIRLSSFATPASHPHFSDANTTTVTAHNSTYAQRAESRVLHLLSRQSSSSADAGRSSKRSLTKLRISACL